MDRGLETLYLTLLPDAAVWTPDSKSIIEKRIGTSLVVQWLRIRLPMQGTWVRSLVREIPHAVEQLSPCATTTEPAL